MTLKTERLILRPWEERDAEDLYRYASNPDVGPIAGWPPHTSVENSREIIREILSAPETYAVVLREEGRAVGSIGLMLGDASNIGIPDTEGEIGYWIGVPFWGRGLIPEATREIMRHGFEDLGLEKLWCGYFDGNEKSRRVQEKCGFRYHHTAENVPCQIDGLLRTEHVTCITREEWENAMPRQSVFDMPPIEGRPELTWPGKHPLRSATWHPTLLRESYGPAGDGWMNKLYLGDNLQAMAHLLRDFRGKVDLVYIDPPFGSNANYGSLIHPKGRPAYPLLFTFGETRFGDVWKRDEYLQFMYERLILIRELLSEKGSLFVHCDRCSQHLLRCLLDEVFGADVEKEGAPGLVNEIVWHHSYTPIDPSDRFAPGHDTIFWYSKTGSHYFNAADVMEPGPGGAGDETGRVPGTVWRMNPVAIRSSLALGYPTQKPEALLERIVLAASAPGSIVMDCFMGSGTTGAVAMRTGRRFLGADVSPASLHAATKRLVQVARGLEHAPSGSALFTGFEVHSVPSGLEDPEPEGDVDVAMADGRLVICGFRPENLVRKLCVGHDFFEDWRHLADSVFVDWDYDGKVFRPSVADVPAGDDLVKGSYPIPEDAGAIRIKVVDVLSEAYEVDAQADFAARRNGAAERRGGNGSPQ